MPTQDEWQQMLRRLEAVEKLTMELLQRVQRLELQIGVKPVSPTETKPARETPKPSATPVTPTEQKVPAEERKTPTAPKELEKRPEIPQEELRPTVKPAIQPEQPEVLSHQKPVIEKPQKPLLGRAEETAKPSKPAFELEMLLGGKVALWVGAVLVLFAASFGLAYSWQFLGPTGRVLLSTFSGLTFVVVGEFAKNRAAKWFVEGITALGLALLYLTIWAAAMRYQILDIPLAFAAMTLVTASGVALSVRHDALSLILFATVGGFLTPVLLRVETTEVSQALSFFGYITLLNAGILAAAAYKRWQVVNFVALFATLLLAGGWVLSNYEPALRWQTFSFVTVNFLIFVGIGIAYPLRFRERSEPTDLTFLLAVTSIYFIAGIWLLWQPLTAIKMPKPLAFMRGVLGIFPLVLAGLWAMVGEMVQRRVPSDKALILTSYGLAVGLLTIAVPMQFRGNPIAMAWAIEAAVLTVVALRASPEQEALEFLQNVAELIWSLALAVVLWFDLTKTLSEWRPILNERFATFAVLIGSSVFIAREYWLKAEKSKSSIAAFASAFSVFWLVAREITAWFGWAGWFAEHQAEAAWLTVFGAWALLAAIFVSFGTRTDLPFQVAQFLAAVVLMVAAVGVFAVGMNVVTADWRLILNPRFVNSLLVVTALTTATTAIVRSSQRSEFVAPNVFTFAAFVLSVATVSQEVYAGFWKLKFPSVASWEVAAWFSIFGLWGVSAIVSWFAGLKWRLTILRYAGMSLWFIASAGLLLTSLAPEISEWKPFINFRVVSFIALIASGVVLALGFGRYREALTELKGKPLLPVYLAAVANFLALWVLTQEVHFLFHKTQFPSPKTWGYAAQGAISVVWAVYAAFAMVIGIVKGWVGARWLGLSLLSLTVLKVFTVDLGFLTLPYRMLSFGVLGLILLGVAWAYSRYGDLIRRWALPTKNEQTRGQA